MGQEVDECSGGDVRVAFCLFVVSNESILRAKEQDRMADGDEDSLAGLGVKMKFARCKTAEGRLTRVT